MYFEHIIDKVVNVFVPDILMIIYIMSFVAIYIGMINPSLVIGKFSVRQTKGMVFIIYGSIFVVALVLNILVSY